MIDKTSVAQRMAKLEKQYGDDFKLLSEMTLESIQSPLLNSLPRPVLFFPEMRELIEGKYSFGDADSRVADAKRLAKDMKDTLSKSQKILKYEIEQSDGRHRPGKLARYADAFVASQEIEKVWDETFVPAIKEVIAYRTQQEKRTQNRKHRQESAESASERKFQDAVAGARSRGTDHQVG